jgi:membrane-associated protease RseP (regulator of RpoE activity)
MDPKQGYALLRKRFATLGYTPILRRQGEYEIVTAVPVVFSQSRPQRWWINLLLFALTIVTTTLMGAILEQGEQLMQNPRLFFQQPGLILTGIPASMTIMGILGIHEIAHYVAARRHGLDSSLPYFIPVPFGLVGTLGAIIRMRTPWENRNSLFDVGAAGPLAGILVALPLFFAGLMISPALPPQPEGTPLGTPLLMGWLEDLVYVLRDIPPAHDIYVNSWTFAAWFGLVVSGFNLLPIGQLDGGHVAYAVLGSKMRILSTVVLVIIGLLGILLWPGWYLWIAFTFMSGWMHPPPLNALEPLSKGRTILGIVVLVLTALLFTPAPFPTL